MRVLQLIDSLRSGGAERMSVNYANALAKRIDGSFLCCTRMEGLLKWGLSPEVGYLFLHKKSTLDLIAFLKLRKFVKENKIDLIQAHSSSWFLALMIKLSLPKLKMVWHDHYGRALAKRKPGFLKPASRLFDGVISVNAALEEWTEKNLQTKEVRFFRNFLPDAPGRVPVQSSSLKGQQDTFKILCLANLRPQKDHLNLLRAFERVEKIYPRLSLHLVGKDEQDDYSGKLKLFVDHHNFREKVFFYGERTDVKELLKQADLGVLSSASEGLPLALLEYGRAGLPVVCTAVGDCPEVVGDFGLLVPAADSVALSEAILNYLKNTKERKKSAEKFQRRVLEEYLEKKILPQVEIFYEKILAK